jgi:hypothetical protein
MNKTIKKTTIPCMIVLLLLVLAGCNAMIDFFDELTKEPVAGTTPIPPAVPTPEPMYEPIALDSINLYTSRSVFQATHSFDHTLGYGSGNNRLVVVSLCLEKNNENVPTRSVTYNGMDMTIAVSESNQSNGFLTMAEIWYLLDNELPASPGTYRVEVGFSDTAPVTICAVSVIHTRQNTPEATATESKDITDQIIVNISTLTDGAWIFDAYQDEFDYGTLTPTHTDQIVRFNLYNTGTSAGSTRLIPIAGTVTNGWLLSECGPGKQVLVAAVFAPAP